MLQKNRIWAGKRKKKEKGQALWMRIQSGYGRGRSRAAMLAGMLALSLLLQLFTATVRQSRIQQGIAGAVVRFHVLANSDGKEDQAVKLRVRDAVLAWVEQADPTMNPEWDGRGDAVRTRTGNARDRIGSEQTLQFLEKHLSEIEAVANAVLISQNEPYRATAALENVYFPERTYGACTFPAGWYEALRIRLGAAKGHNWWCVLYPRLCFTDCLHAVVEEEQQQELSEVLTAEEYETLLHEPKKWKLALRWWK